MQELNRNFRHEEAINFFHKEYPLVTDQRVRDNMMYEYTKAINFKLLQNPESRQFDDLLPVFKVKRYYDNLHIFSTSLSSISSVLVLVALSLYFLDALIIEDRSSWMDLEKNIKEAVTSNKTFKDVKGIDECRGELEDIVNFLKNHEKFKTTGAKVQKGILLTGQPGTGKTLLAKAIAGEAGVKFLYTSGSEFDEVFYGVGAARVRKLFEVARKAAPCIIFIDEIDSMAPIRGSGDVSGSQTLNQLLVELDGFTQNENIIVIGATNFPESIDPALKRSGRFDKTINIMPPGIKGRAEILDFYLEKVKCDPNLNKDIIIKKTIGMTGADLANLVNTASINAAKNNKDFLDDGDIDFSLDRVTIGIERRSFQINKEELMKTAYHELGHAYIAYIHNSVDVHKITILPKGHSLGHTAFLPQNENEIHSFRDIKAYVSSALAGRAAEEVFLGKDNVTTGCSSDLNNATRIVKHGLNSGLLFRTSKILSFHHQIQGQEEKAMVEDKTKEFLAELYVEVVKTIEEKKKLIHYLAEILVEKETITGEEFREQIEIFEKENSSL